VKSQPSLLRLQTFHEVILGDFVSDSSNDDRHQQEGQHSYPNENNLLSVNLVRKVKQPFVFGCCGFNEGENTRTQYLAYTNFFGSGNGQENLYPKYRAMLIQWQ
jgi:hypothetical protein